MTSPTERLTIAAIYIDETDHPYLITTDHPDSVGGVPVLLYPQTGGDPLPMQATDCIRYGLGPTGAENLSIREAAWLHLERTRDMWVLRYPRAVRPQAADLLRRFLDADVSAFVSPVSPLHLLRSA